jgi:hypothetical protein
VNWVREWSEKILESQETLVTSIWSGKIGLKIALQPVTNPLLISPPPSHMGIERYPLLTNFCLGSLRIGGKPPFREDQLGKSQTNSDENMDVQYTARK